jgi:hypothetical protein
LVTTQADLVRSGPIEPSPQADAARLRSVGTGALCLCWVLIATWLQLVRGPGHRAPDVIWAEDGGVFLNQAMRHSLWHNLVTPHAGYLQVIARLVAQPAGHLPITWVAVWLAASAAFVVALISLLVWFLSGKVVQSAWARLLLTALVPLLPQAGFEVNAAVNDLHWYLAYAAFWVLLAAPSSFRGQLGASVVVVLAALSDPLAALVLPIAALGLARAPRRRLALMAPAAMCVALAIQAWVYLTQALPYRSSPTVLMDLPKSYALRVVLSAVTGDRLLALVYVPVGLVAVAAVGVLVLIGLAALLYKADWTARLIAVLSLVISVAYFFVALGLRGTGGILNREAFGLGGSRYTVVPLLLLWVAVIVLLDRLAVRNRFRQTGLVLAAPTLIGIVTASFLGVQLLNDWGAVTVRSGGPSWSASVRTAEATCQKPPGQHGPQPAPLVAERLGRVSVPIVPGPDDVTIVVAPTPPPGEPLLFGVVIPCSSLRNAG